MKVTPSAFARDWFGYLRNQVGHKEIGFGLSLFVCSITYWTAGAFPVKEAVFIGLVSLYVLFELLEQGWNGFDTVEDTLFFSYGVTLPLLASEIVEGSSKVILDVQWVSVLMIIYGLHLILGVVWRVIEKKKSNDRP